MHGRSYVVACVAALCLHAVEACSVTDMKHVNTTAKIISVESASAPIKHSVAGAVKITTGCAFFVRNMTIIPSGNAVYWYGIPLSNTTDPYPRVVAAALGSYNGQSVTFTLDPQFSFSDFIIMEIRSEGDNRAYGAFALDGNVKTVEEYYKTQKGGELDFDSERPFAFGNRISPGVTSSAILLTTFFALFSIDMF